jgi:hypothetical protein
MTELTGVDGDQIEILRDDRLEVIQDDLADVVLVSLDDIAPLGSGDPDQPAPTSDNSLRPDDGPPLDQPDDGELAGGESL